MPPSVVIANGDGPLNWNVASPPSVFFTTVIEDWRVLSKEQVADVNPSVGSDDILIVAVRVGKIDGHEFRVRLVVEVVDALERGEVEAGGRLLRHRVDLRRRGQLLPS